MAAESSRSRTNKGENLMGRARTLPVLLAASFFAAPASAHHSDIAFDTESVVAFQGTVTDYSWRNPHVYVRVETVDTGEPIEWEIQTGSTPIMSRSGWTSDSFLIGDRVTVRGHPERDPDRKYASLQSIEKEDGSLFVRNMGESPPAAVADSLSGRWRATEESFFPAFEALQNAPMTERGAAIQAAYDIFSDSSLLACQAQPAPIAPAMAAVLFVAEIEIGDDVAFIRSEYYDTERTVFMDGRDHPEDGERTNHGHSIGRWEGDTLVVDTTLFSDHPSPYQNGLPSGAQKHVVERYSLDDDGATATVEIQLEDPEYLAEPYTATIVWQYTPDLEMFAYNCNLEVSRQFSLR